MNLLKQTGKISLEFLCKNKSSKHSLSPKRLVKRLLAKDHSGFLVVVEKVIVVITCRY